MDKNCFDEHFLDSNILIGFVLRWDHLNEDCYHYFEEDYSKNTSERVYDESKRKILKYRRIQLDFIDKLYEYSQRSSRLLFNFEDELKRFAGRFIRNNKKNSYFELPKKKLIECIMNFINECHDKIYQIIFDFAGYYEIFLEEIRNSFNEAIDELDNICYDFKDVKTYIHPFESYELEFPHCEDNLKRIGIHNPDHRILLDCYYFRLKKFNKKTAFITKDGKILENSENIQSLLKGVFVHTI